MKKFILGKKLSPRLFLGLATALVGLVALITTAIAVPKDVTNALDDTVDIRVYKVWHDISMDTRPPWVRISLYKNGEIVATEFLTEYDSWSRVFADLPKYDEYNDEYHYYIVEEPVDGYVTYTSIYSEGDTIYVILDNILRYPPTTSVTVAKQWVDANDESRPNEISVILDGCGTFYGTIEYPYWAIMFVDLPEYYFSGGGWFKCEYRVIESPVDGYRTEVSYLYDDYIVITNTSEELSSTVDITVNKEWQDGELGDIYRPGWAEIDLFDYNCSVNERKTLESPGWSWTFYDLPKYVFNGYGWIECNYTVTEYPVPGYSSQVSNLVDGVITVTNTLEPGSIEFEVEIRWVDDSSCCTRPESVTVNIYQDDVWIDSIEIFPDEDGVWSYVLELPKYSSEDFAEFNYTISIDPIPGYSSRVDGNIITNTCDDEEKPTPPFVPPGVPDTGFGISTSHILIILSGVFVTNSIAIVLVIKSRKNYLSKSC